MNKLGLVHVFFSIYLFFDDASDSLQYFLNQSECNTKKRGGGVGQMHTTSTVKVSNVAFC